MKKLMVFLLAGFLLSACGNLPKDYTSQIQNANEIAPYPYAKSGYSRSVIYLPALKDENNARIELVVGKEMLVDCNIHRLVGMIKQRELEGWGYSYYEVIRPEINGISTMMACPENSNSIEFVTMNHDLGVLRYNSKLPIVIYAPVDLQVKYRVWTLSEDVIPAVIETQNSF